MRSSHFDSVVFAGGGNRCLWQAGFWDVVARTLGLAPRVVAGVSAGATVACLSLSGRASAALEHFREATGKNRRNVRPWNALRGRPIFPHYEMYRRAILHSIDAPALARLHEGPDVRVLLARPPAWAGPRTAVALGFSAYELEKWLRAPVHPVFGARVGFVPEVVSVRSCATPDELADVLLASSCTPPFTPVQMRTGRPALDGGLVDNVPVAALDARPGRTLVLLTRRYPEARLPVSAERLYVQPSVPIPVTKWDYTNPEGLREAWELGRRDGESFAAELTRSDPRAA